MLAGEQFKSHGPVSFVDSPGSPHHRDQGGVLANGTRSTSACHFPQLVPAASTRPGSTPTSPTRYASTLITCWSYLCNTKNLY